MDIGVVVVDDKVVDAVHVDGHVRPRDGERRQVFLDQDGQDTNLFLKFL